MGNDFHIRVQGIRIKRHTGCVSIRMYGKLGTVPRIGTNVNDVTFLKHHREVEHRNGAKEMRLAPVRKIYLRPTSHVKTYERSKSALYQFPRSH